jgi:hypothetical protein
MERPGILFAASANVTICKADFVYLQNLVYSYNLLNKEKKIALYDATKFNSSNNAG